MQGTETTHNGVVRIRVSDLLFALQKRWMIIVALSLVGLTFGMILSAMTVVQTSYQTFNINGSFAVTSKNIEGQYVGGYSVPNTNDFHLAEDMVDAVRYVLRSERVLNEVINENELLGYTVATLRNAVTVTQYNSTQVLEMRITWRNAEEGIEIWNSILRHASEILPQTLQLGSLAIINEPRAEQIGVVSGGNNRVVLMTLLGFAAGVGFAVVELLMHPTLNNVRDVETLFGVETIGVIPRDNEYYRRKDSIMTREDVSSSLVVQNFSAAAYILRNRLGTREEHHCFYVTSATAGEGKTTVAAHLAIQLSDMEHKTLLIDFDTRNPNLGALFLNKVDYEHSLNALYRGDVIPDEAITTLSGYLDLLPAVLEHNAINVDNMIVELVENLMQYYEYVILDAPPVGEVSGTLSLNQVANSVLFVIGYDKSSLPEIQSSLEKLDKSGTRVLGCVVNNVVSGRALGITQSADERKKSISKKAREKKREEERFGFDDDGKTATDVKGLFGARDRKNKGKEKKKKGGLLSRRNKETEAPHAGAESEPKPVPTEDTGTGKRRNIYEDTIKAPEKKLEAPTTQETINELVRMGLTNEWGSDQTAEQTSVSFKGNEADSVPREENAPFEAADEEAAPAFEIPAAAQADAPIAPDWTEADSLPPEQNAANTFDAAAADEMPYEQGSAGGEERHVIRSVNLKRRTVRTASKSAPPPQIVVEKENTAAAPAEKSGEMFREGLAGYPDESTVAYVDLGPTDASAPAAESAPVEEAAEVAAHARKADERRGKTGDVSPALYLLLALPVTVVGIAVLVAAAVLFAGASTAGFAFGASGIAAIVQTYTEIQDKLAAGGLTVSALTLGLLLLWLTIRTLLGAIPAFIRAVVACGRRWCGKEEKK